MYELTIELDFEAAHQLRGYEGPCARLHGHNYRLEITVAGERLDQRGLLRDFRELSAACRQVLAPLDHQLLNDIPPFDELNPSSEHLARVMFQQLSEALNDEVLQVRQVRLWETPTASVTYRAEGDE